MKKNLHKDLLIGALALSGIGLSNTANALSITPATLPQFIGNDNNQAAIDLVISPIISPSTELYKANVPEEDSGDPVTEEGTLQGSYTTEFFNEPDDPQDATITWDGGNIVGPTAWLLVKDGNQTPAWYLFNLTTLGWDGIEDLEITGFWPAQGAISHVTLYGDETLPPDEVPDGGSALVLLGLSLAGIGLVRRQTKA